MHQTKRFRRRSIYSFKWPTCPFIFLRRRCYCCFFYSLNELIALFIIAKRWPQRSLSPPPSPPSTSSKFQVMHSVFNVKRVIRSAKNWLVESNPMEWQNIVLLAKKNVAFELCALRRKRKNILHALLSFFWSNMKKMSPLFKKKILKMLADLAHFIALYTRYGTWQIQYSSLLFWNQRWPLVFQHAQHSVRTINLRGFIVILNFFLREKSCKKIIRVPLVILLRCVRFVSGNLHKNNMREFNAKSNYFTQVYTVHTICIYLGSFIS